MKTLTCKSLLTACVAVFSMVGWIPPGQAAVKCGGKDITDNCICATCDPSCNGSAGIDTITCNDSTGCVMHGHAGGDIIIGNSGPDTICGGSSDDDDSLWGKGGRDVIYGGAGDDKLFGGGGTDTLDGGSGTADQYDGGLPNPPQGRDNCVQPVEVELANSCP